MRARAVAAAVAAAALALACGRPDTASPGASPDEPVASSPGGGSGPSGGAKRVRPRPGMADLRATPFVRHRVGPGGRRVSLFFYSGVAPCYVLDHVDLAYGRRAVRATLYVGRDPDGGDRACPELALLYRVDVALEEPLHGRRVLNARGLDG